MDSARGNSRPPERRHDDQPSLLSARQAQRCPSCNTPGYARHRRPACSRCGYTVAANIDREKVRTKPVFGKLPSKPVPPAEVPRAAEATMPSPLPAARARVRRHTQRFDKPIALEPLPVPSIPEEPVDMIRRGIQGLAKKTAERIQLPRDVEGKAFRPASMGRRIGAFVIDGVILASMGVALMRSLLPQDGWRPVYGLERWAYGLSTEPHLLLWGLLPALIAGGLVASGWVPSLGRRIFGLRIVWTQGVSPLKRLSRGLLGLLSGTGLGLGFLFAVLVDDGRALHDRLMHTDLGRR